MAIYTRTGDAGTTSLFTGQRVSKTHPRVEAYGTLDELNAALSLCACAAADENHRTLLEAIQQQLFGLAQSWPATASSRRPNSATSAAKRFRPRSRYRSGNGPRRTAAQLYFTRTLRSREPLTFARTLARRAERRLVELATEVNVRRC